MNPRAAKSTAKLDLIEINSLNDWRSWLVQHHGQTDSIWLVTWKAHRADRYVAMMELVDEALCWGWIDSLPRALDDDRSMRRMSPRRPRSAWSRVNKARGEALLAAGRMKPGGLAVIERARADGSWDAIDEVETLALPDDLRTALQTHPPALGCFEAFPPSARRNILEWISAAKRPETRAARITTTAEMAAQNLRANHARQPKGRSG